MDEFLQDYNACRIVDNDHRRYLNAQLHSLPFADKSFDLVICSHFLFLYSDHLSLEFHLDSVTEMMRVADEIRIFPLLNLDIKRSTFVEPVLDLLTANNWKTSEQSVNYEF